MNLLMKRGKHTLVRVIAAAAVAFSLVTPASAQLGEAAGIGDAMQQDFYKRDVVLISQGLKLDETQRVIINTMFEDYQSAFEAGLERMKKRFDDLRPELQVGEFDKDRIMKIVFGPIREWSAEKQELGAQFLANIEVLLTDDQQSLWPGVQRRLYRERNLHKGRLSGESVNLLDVVRDLHLEQGMSLVVQPVLEAYEIALDRALHQREDPITGRNNPVLASLEEPDPEKQAAALRKQVERWVAVRNVNDDFINQIASAMPEDLGRQFRASALERAYPRIYRETPVQRIFKVARDLPGLDTGVREAVIALEGEFLAELATLNETLLAAVRNWEPIEQQERANEFSRRMAGQEVQPKVDPTRELFSKREEMFRRYVKRLHDLLTKEQFDQLPGAYRWLDQPKVEDESAIPPGKGVERKGDAKGKMLERGGELSSDSAASSSRSSGLKSDSAPSDSETSDN